MSTAELASSVSSLGQRSSSFLRRTGPCHCCSAPSEQRLLQLRNCGCKLCLACLDGRLAEADSPVHLEDALDAARCPACSAEVLCEDLVDAHGHSRFEGLEGRLYDILRRHAGWKWPACGPRRLSPVGRLGIRVISALQDIEDASDHGGAAALPPARTAGPPPPLEAAAGGFTELRLAVRKSLNSYYLEGGTAELVLGAVAYCGRLNAVVRTWLARAWCILRRGMAAHGADFAVLDLVSEVSASRALLPVLTRRCAAFRLPPVDAAYRAEAEAALEHRASPLQDMNLLRGLALQDPGDRDSGSQARAQYCRAVVRTTEALQRAVDEYKSSELSPEPSPPPKGPAHGPRASLAPASPSTPDHQTEPPLPALGGSATPSPSAPQRAARAPWYAAAKAQQHCRSPPAPTKGAAPVPEGPPLAGGKGGAGPPAAPPPGTPDRGPGLEGPRGRPGPSRLASVASSSGTGLEPGPVKSAPAAGTRTPEARWLVERRCSDEEPPPPARAAAVSAGGRESDASSGYETPKWQGCPEAELGQGGDPASEPHSRADSVAEDSADELQRTIERSIETYIEETRGADMDGMDLFSLIGEKRPISRLRESRHYDSTRKRLSAIEADYPMWRKVAGDGNCFYRALLFGILEALIEHQDRRATESLKRQVSRMVGHLELSENRQEGSWYGGAMLLIDMLDLIGSGDMLVERLELNLCDHEFSNPVIHFLRMATSLEMRQNVNKYAEIICACNMESGADQSEAAGRMGREEMHTELLKYCLGNVEVMGMEADQCEIVALSDCLGVSVQVESIAGGVYQYCHNAGSASMGSPTVHLLYLTGHYDLIYPARA